MKRKIISNDNLNKKYKTNNSTIETPDFYSLHYNNIISSLDQQSLQSILTSLVNSHPTILNYLSSLLPKPSLESIHKLLQDSEHKLLLSFPYAKHAPSLTSDYSYNRVKPQLSILMDQIILYLDYFTLPSNYSPDSDHEYPHTCINYLNLCSQIASRIPNWQNPIILQNTKHFLFLKLSCAWRTAISCICSRAFAGKMYSSDVIRDWSNSLCGFCSTVEDGYGMSQVKDEFSRGLGWMAT